MARNCSRVFIRRRRPNATWTTIYGSPAAAFEVHNGVTGIARYYRFPGGLTPTAYEQRLDSRTESQLRRDWSVLKRSIPSCMRLKSIPARRGNCMMR